MLRQCDALLQLISGLWDITDSIALCRSFPTLRVGMHPLTLCVS
jgi:hypothetical protein